MKIDELRERTGPLTKVTGPGDLMPHLARYATKRQEHFVTVLLDGASQIIRIKLVTIGLLNRTLAHSREIFRPAILESAASIILVHNHPSGSLEPSREDRELTSRTCEAGKLLGIEVLDHLIISQKGFYSFKEAGENPFHR
jgi:DNA repair protein RadC